MLRLFTKSFVWPFKWNLFESTFTLVFSISHYEIWKFCWILILVTFGSENVKWYFSRVVENSWVGKLVYCSATLSGRTRRVLKYYAGSTNRSFQEPRIPNFVAENKHIPKYSLSKMNLWVFWEPYLFPSGVHYQCRSTVSKFGPSFCRVCFLPYWKYADATE